MDTLKIGGLLVLGAFALILLVVKPTPPPINVSPPDIQLLPAQQAASFQSVWQTIETSPDSITEVEIDALFAGQTVSALASQIAMPAMTATQLRAAAVANSGIVVDIPEWDPSEWKHAIERRGSLLKVMLVYELIKFSATELYCGTTPIGYDVFVPDPVTGVDILSHTVFNLRCIVFANDPIAGTAAMVFNNSGTPDFPVWGSAVTMMFSSRGVAVETARRSSCASWRIMPVPPAFEPQYEPVPVGAGTCLTKQN